MSKQNKMKVLLFGVVIATLFSCKKSNCEQTLSNERTNEISMNIQGVSSDGLLLSFASNEDYEKAISVNNDGKHSKILETIKNLQFERYASQAVEKTSNDVEHMDEILAQLLNSDGAIQIGRYIYKIDIQKDSVYAIDSKYKDSHYKELINGNTNNKLVVGFSTDEEVLYVVEERMKRSDGGEKRRKWFCNEDGAGPRHEVSDYIFFQNGGWANAGARYARYGVYFKLFFGTTSNLNTSRYHVYLQFENLWYKIRCQTNVMGPMSHPWWKNHNANDQITYVSYSGTRQLNGYHVKARVRVEDWGKSSGSLPYTTTFSDWAKINVNSPY